MMSLKFKDYYNDIIKDLTSLLRIPTVFDPCSVTDKMPYGENVYKGYLWMKQKALSDGFEVLEFDGHALAIRIPGNEGEKRIDVVSHIDVVEPGEGWKYDPFSGAVEGDRIYGRGAQDMKGPLISTYYALKYIRDNNIPCKNQIRVVIGCDEECTMNDMKYYVSKAGEPDFAFTPDGKFPYSMGEKGALMWVVHGNVKSCIKEMKGGVQCNVVSPSAVALIDDGEAFENYRKMMEHLGLQGEVSKEGKILKVKVIGKAAHASQPELGVNATVLLLNLVRLVSRDRLADMLYRCFSGYHGEGADIYYDIEPMGKLTLNIGVLKIKNNTLTANIDCRYPYGISSDVLTRRIGAVLEPLHVDIGYDDKPTLADRDSPYLGVLLNTYREVTHNPGAEPILGMGVTYSKAFANCVAFGPTAEGDPVLAHQANENIEIKKLEALFEIYTKAMMKLAGFQDEK